MEINGIVLVGGQSSRLGRDKSLEIINGESLVKRAINILVPLCKTILLVTAAGIEIKGITETPNQRIITDVYPKRGPLVGLYSGLKKSDTLYNLVVACDMPFLEEKLLKLMIELAPGFDAVVPMLDGQTEPLCAVYSRNSMAAIEKMMEEDVYAVHKIPSKIKTRYLNAQEINAVDPWHYSFININREEDLVKARQLAERLSGDGK